MRYRWGKGGLLAGWVEPDFGGRASLLRWFALLHTEGLGPVQTSVFRDVFYFFRFFGRVILRSVEPLDSRASFLSIKSTHLNLKVSSDCQLLPSITQWPLGQISSAVVQSSSTEDTTQRIGHRFWCVNRRGGSFSSRTRQFIGNGGKWRSIAVAIDALPAWSPCPNERIGWRVDSFVVWSCRVGCETIVTLDESGGNWSAK